MDSNNNQREQGAMVNTVLKYNRLINRSPRAILLCLFRATFFPFSSSRQMDHFRFIYFYVTNFIT